MTGGKGMKILVDADACPVRAEIERTAKRLGIEVIMYVDTAHILKSEYSRIVTVSQGKDAVDTALINDCEEGDIVITQDYGVAALALGKKAHAIGINGKIYDNDNIDMLMFERFLAAKNRRVGKKVRGGKKRASGDNINFKKSFENLCMNIRKR